MIITVIVSFLVFIVGLFVYLPKLMIKLPHITDTDIYTNWYPGEPNGASNEPYTHMMWGESGQWNDIGGRSDIKLYGLCRRAFPLNKIFGEFAITDSSFDSGDTVSAQIGCLKKGGILGRPLNKEENEMVLKLKGEKGIYEGLMMANGRRKIIPMDSDSFLDNELV